MNNGVEILLQRLKDCPEDFTYDISQDLSSRWLKLVQKALAVDFITQEEKDALTVALRENHRNEFTEHVMKHLASVGDETSDEGKHHGESLSGPHWRTAKLSNGVNNIHTWGNTMPIGNGGTGASTVIQLGNEVLDEHILRKIKRKLGL
jgi:hypothetical protein